MDSSSLLEVTFPVKGDSRTTSFRSDRGGGWRAKRNIKKDDAVKTRTAMPAQMPQEAPPRFWSRSIRIPGAKRKDLIIKNEIVRRQASARAPLKQEYSNTPGVKSLYYCREIKNKIFR